MTPTPPVVIDRRTRNLRDGSAMGFIWLVSQTVGSKAVSLLGQMALAWLLVPEDFGLVGLAYTVVTFTSRLREFGVHEVLNRRRRAFHLWSGPGFALSVAAGCVGGVVAMAAAPLAALVYDEPRVIGLIGVLALAGPFWNAAIVPKARLGIEMRFGTIAGLTFGTTLGTVACSVLLAALGAGAYSFVLPRLIVGATQLAVLWRIAPIRLRGAMRIRRWRMLLGDSVYVFVATIFRASMSQGDYFLLGLTVAKATIGHYYFAYSLSMQAAILFSQNLGRVLLPGLSALQRNVGRMNKVAIEAFTMLASLTTPMAMLQAVLAGPGIRLLFDDRWIDAIPLLQLLSVAMAFTAWAWPMSNLFDAQGRFRTRMWFTAASAAAFFLIAAPAAVSHGALGVAVAVVAHRALYSLAQVMVALRGFRRGLHAYWRINGRPLLAASVGAGLAFAANAPLPDGAAWDVARLGIGSAILLTVYTAIAWPLMPDCRRLLVERVGAVAGSVRRRRNRGAAA